MGAHTFSDLTSSHLFIVFFSSNYYLSALCLRSLSLDLHRFETLVFDEKYQESGQLPRPFQEGTCTTGFIVVAFLLPGGQAPTHISNYIFILLPYFSSPIT